MSSDCSCCPSNASYQGNEVTRKYKLETVCPASEADDVQKQKLIENSIDQNSETCGCEKELECCSPQQPLNHHHSNGTSKSNHSNGIGKHIHYTKEETILLIEPDGSKIDPKSLITTKIRVQNMCCAMETGIIKESLNQLEGIANIAVNVIDRVVLIRHNPDVTSTSELIDCLNKVNMGATLIEVGVDQEKSRIPRSLVLTIVYVVLQGLLLLLAVIGLFLDEEWHKWVAISEIIIGIFPIVKNSFYAVKNRRIDINILMLIAIVGTITISEFVEGATVTFLFAVSEGLQMICMYRVQRTISRLMLKRPEVAVLVESGETVPIEDVAIGTLIAIRPGEMIPLDGVVVKGRAAVDESSITGESLPVEKSMGSRVFSGTVNQNGYIEVETTSDSSTSTVSKVTNLVEEAQSSSTQTEAIINRFAKYYTPLVVLIAALLVTIPAVLGAFGVGTYLQDIREWGRRALVMLVISCPCALVMSTPIAVICSITVAARKGSLVKRGEVLETLAKLQVLAFDKTGTLTEGKFKVTNMECPEDGNTLKNLRLAAALETKTIHPISAAIIKEYSGFLSEETKSHEDIIPEVTQFEMHEGQGISGLIEGKQVHVGNKAMLDQCGASLNENMSSKYKQWSNDSKTVVFVCVDGQLSLIIALADGLRENINTTLDWLKKIGVQTSMITGDNKRAAEAVKARITVDEYMYEMKPSDKFQWIKSKQKRNKPKDSQSRVCCKKSRDSNVVVGMVGDGVNDGPALASANVGIAMGASENALAEEAADIALISNNLVRIPELICLARYCTLVIKQNIGASLLMKIAIVAVAFSGVITLWMAVVADVVSLLVVILNGLRPLKWKPSLMIDN